MTMQDVGRLKMHKPAGTERSRLAGAAVAFLAANLLHGADHIRQHLACRWSLYEAPASPGADEHTLRLVALQSRRPQASVSIVESTGRAGGEEE